jgi:hypothetical protein
VPIAGAPGIAGICLAACRLTDGWIKVHPGTHPAAWAASIPDVLAFLAAHLK